MSYRSVLVLMSDYFYFVNNCFFLIISSPNNDILLNHQKIIKTVKHNYSLSRNCETLSRNLRQPLTKNRPFKNADRRTRHRSSPFRDAQIDIIASKTSQTTDRIIETHRLDVLTNGYRHDTKGSDNEVEWDDEHSVSCPTRLAKYACSV